MSSKGKVERDDTHTIQCPNCDRWFTSFSGLSSHQRGKWERRRMAAQKWEEESNGEWAGRDGRIRRKTPSGATFTEKVRRCEYCHKTISSKNLAFHVRTQHPGSAMALVFKSLGEGA